MGRNSYDLTKPFSQEGNIYALEYRNTKIYKPNAQYKYGEPAAVSYLLCMKKSILILYLRILLDGVVGSSVSRFSDLHQGTNVTKYYNRKSLSRLWHIIS